MRTTSSLESMNAVLRRMFPVHPHLFKFMERLQYHEFGKQLNMKELSQMSMEETAQLQMKVPRYKQRDVKIKLCLDKLLDDEEMFTVGDFLTSLSNKSVVPNTGKFVLLFVLLINVNSYYYNQGLDF